MLDCRTLRAVILINREDGFKLVMIRILMRGQWVRIILVFWGRFIVWIIVVWLVVF